MKSLHLETTTRCTLACPACPRTEWQKILNRPVPRADLVIDDLGRFLDCDQGHNITHFELCGDYGDTIYYPGLFDLIEKFRGTKSFTIVTNGSHQTLKFWQRLAQMVTDQDRIVFAIDGLENTNALYRRNADWTSIMQGMDIMVRSQAQVHWKTIVFKHNVHELAAIKAEALARGASFSAEKTHRYGDNAMTPPLEFVETNHVYQESYNWDHSIIIDPACVQERTVTADGVLMPCDWIRNPRTLYKSQLWRQRSRWIEKLRIKNTTLDQAMLVVQDWANFVRDNSLAGSNCVDVLCKMKCRAGCKQNRYIEVS